MPVSKPQKFLSSTLLLVTILMLAFTVTGFSQTFPKTESSPLFPKKDLLFSQVFAGPSGGNVYTASIAVTNRGARTYVGALVFYTDIEGVASSWNPVVNGVPIIGDMVDIVIPPDETRVFISRIRYSRSATRYSSALTGHWITTLKET